MSDSQLNQPSIRGRSQARLAMLGKGLAAGVLVWPAFAFAQLPGDLLISGARGWCVARAGDAAAPTDKVIAAACDGSDPRQRWVFDAAAVQPASDPALCLSGRPGDGGALALAACDSRSGTQPWTLAEQGLHLGEAALTLSRDNKLVVVATNDAGFEPRWTRLSELAARVDAGRSVVIQYPIAATDTASLELERARHVVNQLTPPDEPLPAPRDVSAFPGEVPADAPRVTETVSLDRRFTRFSHVGWSQKPKNWLATGLYAPAGEVVTVTASDDAAALAGVSLRIGANTDVIARTKPGETVDRYASVSLAVPLKPGVNRVRSQYGGLVIVESAGSANVTLPLTIAGAVKAPRFRLGTDSNADWALARNNPAPWAVLEGDKALLVVPSSQVRELEDAQSVMKAYDTAQQAAMDLAGFDGSSSLHPRLHGRQWFVEDRQISVGYGHAGFPIMTRLDWRLASVDAATNWGVMHETGHNYQALCLWAARYGLESTVNLIPLYVAETLRGRPALIGTLRFSRAIAKLGPGFDFDRNADKDDKLVFLAQLRYAFPDLGWALFRQLNRRYRELPASGQRAICASEARQTDTLLELLSDVVGRDLSSHFLNWGVPVSAGALSRVRSRGLPAPSFPTWLVNPE
ncbi:M60 family metallopeptidase [Crenobacter cavernae]|uniref:Peptidase M60 domain-containing protein n=1 Tax=Crenobacter cavernae TaxID=2290923 RepID=A0A345Y9N1_9NEIS|nr:M60 family metallopeptidase [Crenobacter cavernae]AXK40633.1 hypothetical protein DWG20_15060 [Crenobacter cavernae]